MGPERPHMVGSGGNYQKGRELGRFTYFDIRKYADRVLFLAWNKSQERIGTNRPSSFQLQFMNFFVQIDVI